ncbi:hypothetical protein [Gimesia fumaroli]|uniref:Uncharacterized protein n=1 Tax=Gimesia fumaroli TaxID=2527976 RepID=A0A518I6X8_9PLAN|nr:hypothetical protein [Gimesia fumaroli]QDV48830.1 hypothetical protein Enr17x_08440 [Gimesia fumaroli]
MFAKKNKKENREDISCVKGECHKQKCVKDIGIASYISKTDLQAHDGGKDNLKPDQGSDI